MKKKIYPVLLIAALSMTACTEILEPNVEYGSNTYINDYSALVAAVNDLNRSLQERFDALNKLLKDGMADIKLSIDGNTGAITILSEKTESGLADINSQLFAGFNKLNEQMTTLTSEVGKQGQAIVYAMNQNGEILRLQIDTTGKLIAAQILASANALVDVINNQGNTLAERVAALTAAVKGGFADVKVSIDKNTGAITLQDQHLQAGLNNINGTLLNGFTALKTSVDESGNKVVTAIKDTGEVLRLVIDEKGNLISATIEAQAGLLIAAINNQTSTLEARFNALTQALDEGLAKVKVSIDANTGEIKLLNEKTQESLGLINTSITEGFRKLNQTVDDKGNKIVTAIGTQTDAINEQGQLLQITISNTGEALATKIIGSISELNETLSSQNAVLQSKLEAINLALTTGLADVKAANTKVGEILDLRLEAIDAKLSGTNSQLSAINSQLSALNGNIALMNANITIGYTTIKSSIDKLTGKMEVQLQNNTKALVAMDKNMQASMKALKETVEKQGGKIVTAIGENGEVLVTAIDKNGEVISAAITKQGEDITGAIGEVKDEIGTSTITISTVIAGVVDAIEAQQAALEKAIADGAAAVVKSNGELKTAITAAIKSLEDKQDANAKEQIELLKKMLADNGIYKNPDDNSSIYMDPKMWAIVELFGSNSQLYKAVEKMITEVAVPTFMGRLYYADNDGTTKKGAATDLNIQQRSINETALVAGKLQPMDLANGKQVIRVAKAAETLTYLLTTPKPIICVTMIDANGRSTPFLMESSTSKSIMTTTRAYQNGKILYVIRANVYYKKIATAGLPSYEYPTW